MTKRNKGIDIAREIFQTVDTEQGNIGVATFEKNFATYFSKAYCLFTNEELDVRDLTDNQFKKLKERWIKLAKNKKLDDIYYCLSIEKETELFSLYNDNHEDILDELDLRKAFIQLIADTYLEITSKDKSKHNVLFRLWLKQKIISLIKADVELDEKQAQVNETYEKIKNDVKAMLMLIRKQHEKERNLVRENRIKKCIYAYYEIKNNFADIDMEEVFNFMDMQYDQETKDFLHYCIKIQDKKKYDLTDETMISKLINDVNEERKKDTSESNGTKKSKKEELK